MRSTTATEGTRRKKKDAEIKRFICDFVFSLYFFFRFLRRGFLWLFTLFFVSTTISDTVHLFTKNRNGLKLRRRSKRSRRGRSPAVGNYWIRRFGSRLPTVVFYANARARVAFSSDYRRGRLRRLPGFAWSGGKRLRQSVWNGFCGPSGQHSLDGASLHEYFRLVVEKHIRSDGGIDNQKISSAHLK